MNGLCNIFPGNIEYYERKIFLIFVSGKSFFLAISHFSGFFFLQDSFWDSPFPMFYFYLSTFTLLLKRSNLEAFFLVLLIFLFSFFSLSEFVVKLQKKYLRDMGYILSWCRFGDLFLFVKGEMEANNDKLGALI